MIRNLLCLTTALACADALGHDTLAPTPSSTAAPVALPPRQAELLRAWYDAARGPRPSEPFGELVGRVGRIQLGRPYFDPPPTAGPEELRIELESFQCVSFVESSLAVARCLWANDATESCFVREIEQSRYRGGHRDGYVSKLHYFSEWMSDNAQRGRLRELTEALGGKAEANAFFALTRAAGQNPQLASLETRGAMATVETRLSGVPVAVLDRLGIKHAKHELMTGDVVAIVTTKPGILVSHTGLIVRERGVPKLLHASSHHHRVLLTGSDIANYVQRWPDRRGLLVARPLPPAGR